MIIDNDWILSRKEIFLRLARLKSPINKRFEYNKFFYYF